MKVYLNPGTSRCWSIVHCWSAFINQFVWIQKLLGTTFEQTTDPTSCDIAFTECSDPRILSDKMNMVICGECDQAFNYAHLMHKAESLGNIKFLGTVCDSSVSFNCPFLHVRCNPTLDPWTLPSYSSPPFAARQHDICFMRHNTRAKLRELTAKALYVKYVNSPDKLAEISKHLMNFCAENSFSAYNGTDGYITEKLYDAMIAGCIPVYYGGSLSYTIFNPARVLLIDTKCLLQSAIKIKQLSSSCLQHMFDYPILRPDYDQFVAYRKSLLLKFFAG